MPASKIEDRLKQFLPESDLGDVGKEISSSVKSGVSGFFPIAGEFLKEFFSIFSEIFKQIAKRGKL